MDVWDLVLYAGASILALRSLIGLMADHKRTYLERRTAEEKQRLRKSKRRRKTQNAETQTPQEGGGDEAAA